MTDKGGLDLNAAYIDLATARLRQDALPLFAD
jgi:hypothetical protein